MINSIQLKKYSVVPECTDFRISSDQKTIIVKSQEHSIVIDIQGNKPIEIPISLNKPIAQIVEGNILLADCGTYNENIFIYSTNGIKIDSFYAGYAVDDVQVTSSGQIWICYDDEAIFSGSDMAENGLISMDLSKRITFKFTDLEEVKHKLLPYIHDCYALNVVSDKETWVYYYSDFPLVRLINKRVDKYYLDLPVKGSHAFAVKGNTVVFAGAYKNKDLHIVKLDEEKSELVNIIKLLDEKGNELNYKKVRGRGSLLVFQTDGALYTLDVSQLNP